MPDVVTLVSLVHRKLCHTAVAQYYVCLVSRVLHRLGSERYTNIKEVLYIAHHCWVDRWGK
jgi:hypothetical protein